MKFHRRRPILWSPDGIVMQRTDPADSISVVLAQWRAEPVAQLGMHSMAHFIRGALCHCHTQRGPHILELLVMGSLSTHRPAGMCALHLQHITCSICTSRPEPSVHFPQHTLSSVSLVIDPTQGHLLGTMSM